MKKLFGFLFHQQPIWLIVIVFFIFFSVASPVFFHLNNFIIILKGVSVLGLMAIGITFLLISGNFDLSIGSTMALAAMFVIGLQPYGIIIAVIAALLSGVTIGAVNGLLVAKANINSFIVTLATMTGIRGLIYLYTERSIMGTNMGFAEFGSGRIGLMPYVVILFVVVLISANFILRHTVYGRNIFAIGGNLEAAKSAGIRVDRNIIANFVLCGFTAAMSGIIFASQMNAAIPGLGQTYAMTIITAVVLGGTRLSGGYGGMIHTLGGVLAIQILQNGMDLLGVRSLYNTLIMGLILIIVLLVDKNSKRFLEHNLKLLKH